MIPKAVDLGVLLQALLQDLFGAQFIAAVDKRTGQLVWRTTRAGALRDYPQASKSYAAPLVLDVAGGPQLLSPGANWVFGESTEGGGAGWKVT